MIDVLLVLLIIFMVITPLTPKGLDALVPQPPPPNAPHNDADDRTVVIVIDKQGKWRSTRRIPTGRRPGKRLVDIFKTRAEKVVFVKGDPALEFQVVARAIDIANCAGIDKVGLMTAKMEAGQVMSGISTSHVRRAAALLLVAGLTVFGGKL